MLLEEQKKVLRREVKSLLKHVDWPLASAHIHANLRLFLPSCKDTVLSGFWPMAGEEANLIPFLTEWYENGGKCCLPVIHHPESPLDFYEWMPNIPLGTGRYGIPVPKTDYSLIPDIILSPLLAFDCHGYRLGRGGGYYDRTISFLRSQKNIKVIGIGTEQQLYPNVPHDTFDQCLDQAVTDKRIIKSFPVYLE